MIFALAGAILIGVGFFVIATWEISRAETEKRAQLVAMTNSFTSVYARNRDGEGIVPATFRRLGIDHFTASAAQSEDAVDISVAMPGVPGLEINTVAADPRMAKIIGGMADIGGRDVMVEHRIEDGRFLGRTVVPSIANQESCVSCHNAILGVGTFSLGDTMGAFVIESDLTVPTVRNALYAAIVFGFSLIGFWLLAAHEKRRVSQVVSSLKSKVRLEREKTAAEARATFLMSHDSLTGLANRRLFNERLQEEINSSASAEIFVALIDLDGFKSVNDTLGHAAGDALLRCISKRLTEIVGPEQGLVARFGGDEFAIVVRQSMAIPSGVWLGRRIIEDLSVPFSFERSPITPSGSVGIVTDTAADFPTVGGYLQAADAALYAAKEAGKNRFQIFDAAISAALRRRLMLKAALPDAIAEGQVSVVLQAKVLLETGAITGFEALARWTLGSESISPEEFVPVAEETGLICDLDLCILRQAAIFALDLSRAAGVDVPFSANLSARSLSTPNLAAMIMDFLQEVGLPPHWLTLEITESVAIENWDSVEATFAVLRRHGVRASLDDFGTGYSSLSYLHYFGFEELKIDRSFVANIESDASTSFLFENIVTMATGLGCDVVVEGIETEEQRVTVASKGVTIAQGFLFSRPLRPEEARDAFLAQQSRAA